jgi:hypothetical protein
MSSDLTNILMAMILSAGNFVHFLLVNVQTDPLWKSEYFVQFCRAHWCLGICGCVVTLLGHQSAISSVNLCLALLLVSLRQALFVELLEKLADG